MSSSRDNRERSEIANTIRRVRILLVDYDSNERSAIESFFRSHSVHVEVANDATEMRAILASGNFDLAILEPRLPNEEGLDVYKRLRMHRDIPVIMLSRAGSDLDRILGLEMGADDYVVKPCNPRELLARIRAVLRRQLASETNPPAIQNVDGFVSEGSYRFCGWLLDPISRLAIAPSGKIISLKCAEFRLLCSFLEHPRTILSRADLMRFANSPDDASPGRSVDVQVSRLRKILSSQDEGESLIRTVRGEGYIFVAAVDRE